MVEVKVFIGILKLYNIEYTNFHLYWYTHFKI